MNAISIIDKDYNLWLNQLSERYHHSRIRAAVRVNQEQLRFYYFLGKGITELKAESRWGNGFYDNLSKDLQTKLPNASCFSVTNLKYMKYFYDLYNPCAINCPQVGDELEGSNQPIAISEYDLQRLYPEKVEGIIPTIEELEKNLEIETYNQQHKC